MASGAHHFLRQHADEPADFRSVHNFWLEQARRGARLLVVRSGERGQQ
jgi:hypothetical protein